jgi:hypothetical protein
MILGSPRVASEQGPASLALSPLPTDTALSPRARTDRALPLLVAGAALLLPAVALAHGVDDQDRAFLEQSVGPQILSFIWLGAKHMVTGYDHLLFLVGVIFFLHRMRDVAIYVSLFALGHSLTLTGGVLTGTNVNPFLIDAIIGLSVVYKGMDNLGVFKDRLGFQPDTRVAVFVFGLFHGLGLATKLQEFSLSADGLVPNILSFNVGVELGQFVALAVILVGMRAWRATAGFARYASAANVGLVLAGVALTAWQVRGYLHEHEHEREHAPAPAVAAAPPASPEADAASAPAPTGDAPYAYRTDAIDLILRPNEGTEVKATMRAGDQMLYAWKADGELMFEFHGDPKGAAADAYQSYAKGVQAAAEGEFEASFEGVHGWYWRNRTKAPVTLHLETRGVYAKISRL